MIMSTLALTSGEAAALPGVKSPRPGLFHRLIEARERRAKRVLATYLAVQTDERLLALGLTVDEIAALRAQTR